MSANINDYFTNATTTTRPVPDALTGSRSIGASSISCSALTAWPTATAVHFIIYRVDTNGRKVSGSQTDWKGIVSGTTITGLVLKAGTDTGDSIGAIVEASPTAAWANDMVTGLLVSHNQDGTIKNGAVSTAAMLGSGVVTAAKMDNAGVFTGDVTSTFPAITVGASAITPNKVFSGTGTSWAWQSWTPSWTNLTIGNAVVVAKYIQIGKTVYFRLTMTFGTTTSVAASTFFTLPVTSIAAYQGGVSQIGAGMLHDTGTQDYPASIEWNSTTTAQVTCLNATGTYLVRTATSSTVPFTWTTGDIIDANGFYEAA